MLCNNLQRMKYSCLILASNLRRFSTILMRAPKHFHRSTRCTYNIYYAQFVTNVYFGEIKIRIVKWRSCETFHRSEYTALLLLPPPLSSRIKRRMEETVNYMGRASRRLYRHVGLNLYDQPLSRGRISSAIGPPHRPTKFCSRNVCRNFASTSLLRQGGPVLYALRDEQETRESQSERQAEIAPHRIRRTRERRTWRSA